MIVRSQIHFIDGSTLSVDSATMPEMWHDRVAFTANVVQRITKGQTVDYKTVGTVTVMCRNVIYAWTGE